MTAISMLAAARRLATWPREEVRLARARRADPVGVRTALRVRSQRLTFLDLEALLDLSRRVRDIEAAGVAGSIVEAGCALGGSAIVLAAAKDPARPMSVHDVFGMIPPPGDRDGSDVHERYREISGGGATGFAGEVYYGYQDDLKGRVEASFADLGYPVSDYNVSLVEGLFEDTVRPVGPVALGHIDGDWYESVKVCLDRLWPALSPGGALVIDDYDDWSGCRTAVDEFVARTPSVRIERRARLHLVKPLHRS